MLDTAFFVSKRLQRIAAAFLCLMLAQAFILTSCTPELAPMAARVAITR